MSETQSVRIGLIGLGGMGTAHAKWLTTETIPGLQLTAVCDTEAARMDKYRQLERFADYRTLHSSGAVNAVLIATPHAFHAAMTIDALERGLHVLVEKPLALHLAEGQRMIQAHQKTKQIFAVMLNQRTDPRFRKAKELIDAGRLGTIQRVNWICTHWYRPEVYYRLAPWRGTWKGEGGGLLLTLCLHELDILQWLCGMPARVRSFCAFGKYHRIEVEDEVTAYLEYASGATGVFVATNGEAPGTNRLEIAGDRGCVIVEEGRLSFTENAVSARDHSQTADNAWSRPEKTTTDFAFDNAGGQHVEVLRNFADAIRTGTPLIAPARDGLRSLELVDAILYSAFTDGVVQLPLNAAAFEKAWQQRIAQAERK